MTDPLQNHQPTKDSTVLVVNLMDPHDATLKNGFGTRSVNDFLSGKQLQQILPSPKQPGDKDTLISTIMDSVRAHIAEHGTYSELRFGGHGSPGTMYFSDPHTHTSQPLATEDLLNAIQGLQKELGVKIADKISFLGCNVFTNMDEKQVGFLRAKSQTLDAELVGSTDYAVKSRITGVEDIRVISFKDGQVGHFTPDNSIPVISTLTAAVRAITHTAELTIPGLTPKDTHWLTCHELRSQEAGAACQQAYKVSDAKAGELLSSPLTFLKAAVTPDKTPSR